MIYRLVVPGPIEDVEEIRVLEWHGPEGKAFEVGELLVELETHKAVVEVRAAQKAVLRRVLCREGDWQQVGRTLALFSDTAEEEIPKAEADAAASLPVEFDVT